MQFTPEIQKRLKEWLSDSYDDATKSTIRSWMATDPKRITDAFYTDLSFGTGGLRGVMGIGSARLNEYTIQKATQGLANYLRQKNKGSISVAIGYDNRKNSAYFAEKTALVLAANGITAYLFNEMRPTPFISFVCRFKKCSAAIMITASHNPPEYNGYKVYWSHGGQVVPPHDDGVIAEVNKIEHFQSVKHTPTDLTLIHRIGSDWDDAYITTIAKLQNHPKQNAAHGKELKIVYTSLHGSGITLMPKALESWGFSSLSLVKNQTYPDPEFTNAKNPNPEAKETLQPGIAELKQIGADIVIATDPDADRIGAAVHHKDGCYLFNGNELAAICAEYLCRNLKEQNKLPKNAGIISTIVTTPLLGKIAAAYKVAYFEVLTGFKYIGEMMEKWSEDHSHQFIFGAEESYGYLIGDHARDKDAIVTGCLLAEIALDAKLKQASLVDILHKIYKQYGIFREKQLSISRSSGQEGLEEINEMMRLFRAEPLKDLAGKKVTVIEDYLAQTGRDLLTNKEYTLTLPKSDVMLFRFDDHSKLVIRPSGTEPKIKIYGFVEQKVNEDINVQIRNCDQNLETLLQACQKLLLSLIKKP